MLPRAHRVIRPDDFRRAVRRGRRIKTEHVLVHHVREADVDGPLVGVIVSKHVGGAVVRNRVRRRIMAALGEYLSSLENQDLIVIRALPGAHQVPWDTLRTEIGEGIRRAAVR